MQILQELALQLLLVIAHATAPHGGGFQAGIAWGPGTVQLSIARGCEAHDLCIEINRVRSCTPVRACTQDEIDSLTARATSPLANHHAQPR